MFTSRNNGFTLAEVLITLGVIGIVAAMTLPTVVNKYKIKILETSFKRTYSILIRALDMTSQEFGMTNFTELKPLFCEDLGQFDPDTDKQEKCTNEINKNMPEINNVFRKYLAVIDSETITPNMYTLTNFSGNKFDYTYLGALAGEGSSTKFTMYYLKDGSTITGMKYRENQITLVFDTNGPKQGPNRLGYDIYGYEYPKWRNCQDWCTKNRISTSWMNGLGCWYCATSNVSSDGKNKYWETLY